MLSVLVIVIILYVVIFKKVLGESGANLSELDIVDRQVKKVVMVFFAPLLIFMLTMFFSGGQKQSGGEGDGAILWVYLLLIPGCLFVIIALMSKKRAIRKRSKQPPQN